MSTAAQLTYRYDRWRAPFHGVCEAGWVTFGLLIVIRGYGADADTASINFIKSLIPAAGFLGFLFNPASIVLAGKSGWRATCVVSAYLTVAGLLLAFSAAAGNLLAFVLLFVLAQLVFAQQAPMMIQTYSANYTPKERGQKVSTVLVIVAGSSATFSFLGGRLLDWHFDWFPAILLLMAGACAANAALVQRMPSQPLQPGETGNPLRSFSLVWRDRVFGWLLASWMLMGLGNLMTIPIRVEILANPDYGIDATNGQVALATVILPAAARLVSGKVWGALFDRMNFIAWRICVNGCFFLGMLLYFSGPDLRWIYLGAVLIGFGMGGGMIGWNLWVTKVAPTDKVSAYMSVHTAFTGVRGVAAPFLGYAVLLAFEPRGVGWLAAGLIVVSSLMFSALWRDPRFRQLR